MVGDAAKLTAIWTKASELAVKFLDEDKAVVLVRNAGNISIFVSFIRIMNDLNFNNFTWIFPEILRFFR